MVFTPILGVPRRLRGCARVVERLLCLSDSAGQTTVQLVYNEASKNHPTGFNYSKDREDVETFHKRWYKEAMDITLNVGVQESMPRLSIRQACRDNHDSRDFED